MAGTINQEKYKIEWDLNCSAKDALRILSESTENIIRPWFMTKTNIKGIIINNKFLIWPNTLFSAVTEIVLTGRIIQNGNNSQLIATARLLPPYNLFPSSQAANWFTGITMFIAWLCMAVGLVVGKDFLVKIFMPVFVITCVYNLIQLVKYIQKPELVDLKKHFHSIFKGHIKDS